MLSFEALRVKDQTLYVGQAIHKKYGVVHVFGCQATISSERHNTLVFPIPSSDLGDASQVVVSDDGALLNGILNAQRGVTTSTRPLEKVKYRVETFPNGSQIRSNFGVLLSEFYQGCSMLTCEVQPFNGEKNFSLLCWYKPFQDNILFVPTVQGNSTHVDFNKEVPTNYWVFMSTLNSWRGVAPKYENTTSISGQIDCLFPGFVFGKQFEGWYRNADTISSVEAIDAGLIDGIHRRPFLGLQHG